MESGDQTKQEETTSKFIKTAGGFEAIKQGELIIRKSDSVKRLHEDGETYDEYKIRMRLLKKIEKEYLKGKLFWQSRFSIGGRNYTSTFVKAKAIEAQNKINELKAKEVSEKQTKKEEDGE